MTKFGYRAYLDGIRGIAVFVVVLFHTGGFLITRVILSEIDRSGTLSIIGFYGRRVRRILPGATISLILISILFIILVDAVTVQKSTRCFKSASVYMANICFVNEAVDYWAEETGTSPIKHFWSLSIEEQYYLLYPFTILLVVKFVGYVKKNVKHAILIVLVCVTVTSFIYCIYLSFYADLSKCHMNTFGRWYQLGSGGVLGVLMSLREENTNYKTPFSSTFYNVLAGVFLILILFLMSYPMIFPNLVVHPSYSGIIMTILVYGIIYFIETEDDSRSESTDKHFITKSILVSKPLTYLGKWSYSIYLWHFPIIIFGDELYMLPKKENIVDYVKRVLIICVGSLILGIISYYIIEKPFMKIRPKKKILKAVMAFMGIIIPSTTLILVAFLFMGINKTGMEEKFSPKIDVETLINESTKKNMFVGRRTIVYGDSHCKMGLGAWLSYHDAGFKFSVQYGPSMPAALWNGVEKDKSWDALNKLPQSVIPFKPDLFLIYNYVIQRECYLRGKIRCNNLKGYMKGVDSIDYTKFEEKLYKVYTDFLDKKVYPTGVKYVVHLLPPPEISEKCTDVCYAKHLKQKNYVKGMCDVKSEHRYSWEYVVRVLERVEKERNGTFKYINMVNILFEKYITLQQDDFVCPEGICSARFNETVNTFVGCYHISLDYWEMRSNDFLFFLKKNDVYLLPPDSNSKEEYTISHTLDTNDNFYFNPRLKKFF